MHASRDLDGATAHIESAPNAAYVIQVLRALLLGSAGFLCLLSYMARYDRQHRLLTRGSGSPNEVAPDSSRPHSEDRSIKTGCRVKAHASFFASSGKSTGSHPATPALVTEYRIYNMIVSMHTKWIYCSNANRGLFCITCQHVSTAACQAYQNGICLKPPLAPCLCRRRGFKSQAK